MRSRDTFSLFHLIAVGNWSMVQLVATEPGYAVCRARAEQLRITVTYGRPGILNTRKYALEA